MASKKKVSAFAIFLIVSAVAMTMFLSVIKNIVPVPLFMAFSMALLYVIGFAVYMICKNRTFKWFLPENRSHKKKTSAVTEKAPENSTSTAKVEPEVRTETKETKPASKKPQATKTNKPATAKKSQTTAKKKPVAPKKPASAEITATANTEITEEKKAKSTSAKPATTGTGAKPRFKPAEKASES